MKKTTKFSVMKTVLIAVLVCATTVINAQSKIYLGMRVPQMTTEDRKEIGAEANPETARGQLIFNNDINAFQFWNGNTWETLNEKDPGIVLTSYDGTVRVKVTSTGFDLSVNVGLIADSLVSNETFITNLGDTLLNNQTFITKLGDTLVNNETFVTNLATNNTFIRELITNEFIEQVTNVLYDDTHLKTLIDSITNMIKEGGDVTNLITEIVNQITQETFITQLGDSLAYYFSQTNLGDTILNFITNQFPKELGDTILSFITNHVTKELTDSIMSNVTITGDNGITVVGSGTSNMVIKLPEGERDDQVLTWDNGEGKWKAADPTPSVKQVTIPVTNGGFDTKNLIFFGKTSAPTKPLKVVSIEPVFTNNVERRVYLSVESTAQVVNNAVEWMVSIENRNISTNRKFALTGVVISYICDDTTTLTSAEQSTVEIGGY